MIRFLTLASVFSLSACGVANQSAETKILRDEHEREIQLTAKDHTTIQVRYTRDDRFRSINVIDHRDFTIAVQLSQFRANPTISARFIEICTGAERHNTSDVYDVILNTNSMGTEAAAALSRFSHRTHDGQSEKTCKLTLKVFVNGKALIDPMNSTEEFLLEDINAVAVRERTTTDFTHCVTHAPDATHVFSVVKLGDTFALDYVRMLKIGESKSESQQVRLHGAHDTRIVKFGRTEGGRTWFWGKNEFATMTVAGGLGVERGKIVFPHGLTLPSGETLPNNTTYEFTGCRFSSGVSAE